MDKFLKNHWRFLLFMGFCLILSAQAWAQSFGDKIKEFPGLHWGDTRERVVDFTVPHNYSWELAPMHYVDEHRMVQKLLHKTDEDYYSFVYMEENEKYILYRIERRITKEYAESEYAMNYYSDNLLEATTYPSSWGLFHVFEYKGGDIVILIVPERIELATIVWQVLDK